MKPNTKTIIGLGVIFVTMTMVAMFLFRRPDPRPPTPQVLVPPAPTLGIPQPANVRFTFLAPPSIPEVLPTYTYTDYSLAQLESAIQKNLNLYRITSPPSSITRSGVFKESWLGEGAEFVLSWDEKASVISFRQFKANSPLPAAMAPVDAATLFITSLITLPAGATLAQAATINDVSEGLLILDSFIPSFVRGTTFSYLVDGYPIVSPPHASDATVVAIDNYGIIRSATIVPPPQSLILVGEERLLAADGIMANLSQQKGVIISAGTTGYDLTGLVDFRFFSIDKTSVVYTGDNGFLYPAFLLHGFGANSAGTRQEATFFLWATAR